ncbi:hypothetical protein [Prosthecobacter sp.]|uniref:hypothetical protein n=1 Tax=Prosthecobacter sp. TaxID=1965333 RepID=UPI001DB7144A|nr:hypothetical protein [Prosthecobacter sp.]MCB1279030.1 hypothetical protein [Prosthecobacter sp.]
MNIGLILRSLLALLLIVGLWLAWWIFGRSPEAQVRAAQASLIEAVEERDWDALEKLIAPNYTDAYGHNREAALQDGRKFLSGFFTLTLKTDQTTIRAAKGQGMVTTMIRLEGNGVGYSQMILGHVNQLTEPWIFHWSNPGRWPWDWQVNMIHNDQVR